MSFAKLAGNEGIKKWLRQRDRYSHAYIISGAQGTGKHSLAQLLAAAMVCTGQKEAPCLHCPHCHKVLRGLHPDVILLNSPAVVQVRALCRDAYVRPNEGARKVYILENAQSLHLSAQNALLKLLEESPEYNAFLLLTESSGALVPTIRSRCQELTMEPVIQEEAEVWLRARFPEQPRELIRDAAARCEGVLGRAVRQVEDAGWQTEETRVHAMEFITCLAARDELSAIACMTKLETLSREQVTAFLEHVILLLRDSLCHQLGRPASHDGPWEKGVLAAADSLTKAELVGTIEVVQRLLEAGTFYLGGGHCAGWLVADCWEAILTESRRECFGR